MRNRAISPPRATRICSKSWSKHPCGLGWIREFSIEKALQCELVSIGLANKFRIQENIWDLTGANTHRQGTGWSARTCRSLSHSTQRFHDCTAPSSPGPLST